MPNPIDAVSRTPRKVPYAVITYEIDMLRHCLDRYARPPHRDIFERNAWLEACLRWTAVQELPVGQRRGDSEPCGTGMIIRTCPPSIVRDQGVERAQDPSGRRDRGQEGRRPTRAR